MHSDVGGGYAESHYSDIALQWMIEKAQAVGLKFDPGVLVRYPLKGDSLQKIHDSRTGLYRLARGADRVIGMTRAKTEDPLVDDPTQSLHPSVRQRWDEDAAYRPPGLRDYFRRKGDPRED